MIKAKVLLVDDEVEFATALAERLRYRNYEATAVFSASEAIAAARRETTDVMIVDLKLPGANGLDIIRAVRQFDPHVEAILLSGHGAITSEELGGEGDILDFAMKPIDIDDLIVKIDRAKQLHDRHSGTAGGRDA